MIACNPAIPHTSITAWGDFTKKAIDPVVVKIPDPSMLAMTRRTAVSKEICAGIVYRFLSRRFNM
jgi:hypothetical protein